MKKLLAVLVLAFAFCGLANSAYLTQHEVDGTPLLCDVQGLTDCNVVASSPYSHIFGISLAEYGLIFYGVLFILAAIEIALPSRPIRRVVQGMALLGFLASLYFTFLQVYVINALCVYCTASALLALAIFVVALFLEPIRPRVVVTITRPAETTTFSMPPRA